MSDEPLTREQGDRIIALLERIARNTERGANNTTGPNGPYEFHIPANQIEGLFGKPKT